MLLIKLQFPNTSCYKVVSTPQVNPISYLPLILRYNLEVVSTPELTTITMVWVFSTSLGLVSGNNFLFYHGQCSLILTCLACSSSSDVPDVKNHPSSINLAGILIFTPPLDILTICFYFFGFLGCLSLLCLCCDSLILLTDLADQQHINHQLLNFLMAFQRPSSVIIALCRVLRPCISFTGHVPGCLYFDVWFSL